MRVCLLLLKEMLEQLQYFTPSINPFAQQYQSSQEIIGQTDCRTIAYVNQLLKMAGKTTIWLRTDDSYTDKEIRDMQSSFRSIYKELELWQGQKTICQGCAQLREQPNVTTIINHFKKYIKIKYNKKRLLYQNNKVIIDLQQSKTKKIREFAKLIHDQKWCKIEVKSYNKIPQDQKHPFLIELVPNISNRPRDPIQYYSRSKSRDIGHESKSAKNQPRLKHQQVRTAKVEVKREEQIKAEVKREVKKQESEMDFQK